MVNQTTALLAQRSFEGDELYRILQMHKGPEGEDVEEAKNLLRALEMEDRCKNIEFRME